jgi:hypothetical protein
LKRLNNTAPSFSSLYYKKELSLMLETPLYRPCSKCKEGKILSYPLASKVLVSFLSFFLLLAFLFALWGSATLLQYKLEPKADKLKFTTPGMKLIFTGAIFFLCAGIPSLWGFNLRRQVLAWLRLECPACEEGYCSTQRRGNGSTVIFFLDRFFFEEILIPMFYALTFQRFWRGEVQGKKRLSSSWRFFLEMIFHLFLFFGSIPFLIFVLGQKHPLGLWFALAVLFYLFSRLFMFSEEDPTHKGIIFLLLPLYYVSMVEILQWAWVMSSEGQTPDMSELLFLGLENLIKTQIFLDFFEVFEMDFIDLENVNLLAHGAIFITRLLLDAAVISLLIRAFLKAFQQAWVFKHTGERHSESADTEALSTLEELSILRSPRKVKDVQETLPQIFGVLSNTQKYLLELEPHKESLPQKEALEHCLQLLAPLDLQRKADVEHSETPPKALEKRSYAERLLTVLLLSVWALSFGWGIQHFIQHLTRQEIAFLMKEAEENYADQPFPRLKNYERVLNKDAQYLPALLLYAKTVLDIAEHYVYVSAMLPAEQYSKDFFGRLKNLKELRSFSPEDQTFLEAMEARAYAIRGKIFFFQKENQRALSEVSKKNTKELRSLTSILLLSSACEHFLQSQSAESEFQQVLSQTPKEEVLLRSLGEVALGIFYASEGEGSLALRQFEAFLKISDTSIALDFKPQIQLAVAETLVAQQKRELAHLLLEELLKSQKPALGVYLGKAQLLGESGDFKGAQEFLQKALEVYGERPEISLALALMALESGLAENQAFSLFEKVGQKRAFSTSFQEYLKFLWTGRITLEDFETRALLRNPNPANPERIFGYFYLGLVAQHQKQYGKAEIFFKKVLLPLEKEPEGQVIRQALIRLHRLLGKEENTLDSRFFFPRSLLQEWMHGIQQELIPLIFPPQAILHSFQWLKEKATLEMQQDSFASLVHSSLLPAPLLIPLLEKLFVETEDWDLKRIALEGFFKNPEMLPATATLAPAFFAFFERPLEENLELQKKQKELGLKIISLLPHYGMAALPTLEKLARHQDLHFQQEALKQIGRFRNFAEKLLPVLQEQLYSSEAVLRESAFQAILSLGEEAFPLLKSLWTSHPNLTLALRAFSFLEKSDPLLYEKEKKSFFSFLIQQVQEVKDPSTLVLPFLLKLQPSPADLSLQETQVYQKILQESLQAAEPFRQYLAARRLLDFSLKFQRPCPEVLPLFFSYLSSISTERRERLLKELTDFSFLSETLPLLFLCFSAEELAPLAFHRLQELAQHPNFSLYLEPVFQEIKTYFLSPQPELVQRVARLFREYGRQLPDSLQQAFLFLLLQESHPVLCQMAQDFWREPLAWEERHREAFRKGLHSESLEIQKTHLALLPRCGNEGFLFLKEIKPLLQSPEPSLVLLTLRALSFYRSEAQSVLAEVKGLLPKANVSISQELFAEILFYLGLYEGIDFLMNTLALQYPQRKGDFAFALGELFPFIENASIRKTVESYWIRLLQEKDPVLVLSSLKALTRNRIASEEFLNLLIRLEKHKNQEIAQLAHQSRLLQHLEKNSLFLLERWESLEKTQRESLLVSFFEEIPEISVAFLELLLLKTEGDLREKEIVEYYLPSCSSLSFKSLFLDSPHPQVLLWSLEELKKRGEKIPSSRLRTLIENATDPESQRRWFTLWLQFGYPETLEDIQLVQKLSLQTTDQALQMEALWVLFQNKDWEALEKLKFALKESQTPLSLRLRFLEKFSQQAPALVLPFLIERVLLPSPDIPFAEILRILGEMGATATEAIPTLLDLLEDPKHFYRDLLLQTLTSLRETLPLKGK